MTTFNRADFNALPDRAARAKYLLSVGITTRPDIISTKDEGPDLVARAFVGPIALPITGADEEEALLRALTWLADVISGKEECEHAH